MKQHAAKLRANLCTLILLTFLCWVPIFAQNASVTVGKRGSRIPKACEGVVPASIDRPVDIPALVKEAYCKGAGDMMTEYSYVLNSAGRSKDKKGQTKEDSTTYEVFIPTLKSGTRGNGVLVVTSRRLRVYLEPTRSPSDLDAGKPAAMVYSSSL